MIFTIAQLENWEIHSFDEARQRWIPLRPAIVGFRRRLKAAWLVLQGKADAVTWN